MLTVRHLVPISICVALAALAIIGCSEDNAVARTTTGADGSRLFGLESNRFLTYLRTDTVTDPQFNIVVTEAIDTVRISGADQDWIVKANNVSVINLKVTDGWVIQNGYWKQTGGTEQISYFADPPVLMPRDLQSGERWDGTYPPVDSSVLDGAPHFYYSYFGFYFTRHFVGTEQLQLPGGSFNAHRFNVELFRDRSDTAPAVEVTEFFVPNIGLVKLRFNGGALRRTLSLIHYE